MNASVLKICQDMTTKLIDLERKAQHDVVYYKGAKEAVALVVSEMQRIAAMESKAEQKEENERREQSAAESRRTGTEQGSVSEVGKERAKRQKATN